MGSHFWLNLIATTYILFKTLHFHCGLKMIRISVLLGLFLLVSGVLLPGIPQNFDDRDTDEKELVEDDNEEGIDRLGKAAKKEKNKDKKAKKDKSKLSKEERKKQKASKQAAKLERQKAKE